MITLHAVHCKIYCNNLGLDLGGVTKQCSGRFGR